MNIAVYIAVIIMDTIDLGHVNRCFEMVGVGNDSRT
jgi:hypothetical protein